MIRTGDCRDARDPALRRIGAFPRVSPLVMGVIMDASAVRAPRSSHRMIVLLAAIVAGIGLLLPASAAQAAPSTSITVTVTFPKGYVDDGSGSQGWLMYRKVGTSQWSFSDYYGWSPYNAKTRASAISLNGLQKGAKYQLALAPFNPTLADAYYSNSSVTGVPALTSSTPVTAGSSVSMSASKGAIISGTVTFPKGSNQTNRQTVAVATAGSSWSQSTDPITFGTTFLYGSGSSSSVKYSIAVLPGFSYRVGAVWSGYDNNVYGNQWALPAAATTTTFAKAPQVKPTLAAGSKASMKLSVPATTIWPQPELTATGAVGWGSTLKQGAKLSVGGVNAWPKGTTATYKWELVYCRSTKKLGTSATYTVTAADAKALSSGGAQFIMATVTLTQKGHNPATQTLRYEQGGCGGP